MKRNLPITGRERDYRDDANILSTTDERGVITYINDDFVEVSGFDRKDLLGRSHNVVRHPEMPPEAFADLWATLKAGRAWMGLVKNRCRNGDHYWVDAYVTPVRRHDGTTEYQSVRIKPPRERVAAAERLYRSLGKGRLPWAVRRRPTALRWKLIAVSATAMLPPVLVAAWFGGGAVACATYALGVVVSGGLVVALVRPLERAACVARGVLDNRITQYVYAGRTDEAGQIIAALHACRAATLAVVGRTRDAVGLLHSSSAELGQVTARTGEGVRRQDEETARMAAAIQQMSAAVQEVAENAQRTAEASADIERESARGRDTVHRTTDSINALADELEQTATLVGGLQQEGKRIGVVLDVIRDVAEQTNLLALNAAIEAARAGDSGRGFSVVADEVRGLAARTHASTQEIQTMIESLRGQAERAAEASMRSVERADQAVELSTAAVQALVGIADSMNAIRDMNAQIAAAVEQQSASGDELSRRTGAVCEITDFVRTHAQRAETAGGDLSRLAHELDGLAREFWRQARA